MPWLSFAELDARADELDGWIAKTEDIDRFCSSAAWVLPAQQAFAPQAAPLIWSDEYGMAVFMAIELDNELRVAVPLEASWGLASGLVSPKPDALLANFVGALRARPAAERPRLLSCSGVMPTGPAARALAHLNARIIGPATERIAASLEGGIDGFFARRSAKFRASVGRARRLATTEGIHYERCRHFDDAVEQRILAIERRSWKGQEGAGIDAGPMRDFYREMLPRLARRGTLRVVFVRLDDTDIAYCFGGLFGASYRGLQISFDDTHARHSPGVLAHMEMIAALIEEGASEYDLGTDMEYKRRWGEPGLTTASFVIAL